MSAYHFSFDDFGIQIGFPHAILMNYRIEPDKKLGRGGFRFRFINSKLISISRDLEYIDVEGSFSNAISFLKKTINIGCSIVSNEYTYHLYWHDTSWKEYTVDDLGDLIHGFIKRLFEFMSGAYNNTYECDSWVEDEGYHFIIWTNTR